MVSFDEALNDWLKTVATVTDLTAEEQSKITKAGAEVFKKELEDTTRREHYRKDVTHSQRKHLADDIAVQTADVDGRKTGKTTVGWQDKMNATIARWLNDGTIKMRGDHFVTNVQQDKAIQRKVLLAEKAEYEKIVRKAGQ